MPRMQCGTSLHSLALRYSVSSAHFMQLCEVYSKFETVTKCTPYDSM